MLFGSVLGLSILTYAYTVHIQGLWKLQHGQLKRLQTQERQQGEIDENIKHQLAEAAEQPQSKLIEPSPDLNIFIPSAPQRPTKPLPRTSSTKSVSDPKPPLGY